MSSEIPIETKLIISCMFTASFIQSSLDKNKDISVRAGFGTLAFFSGTYALATLIKIIK